MDKTELIKTVFRNNLVILSLVIVGYIFKYTLYAILARALSATTFGDLILTIKITVFVLPFVLVGTQFSSIKYLPFYRYRREIHKLHGFIKWNIKIFALSTVICIMLATIFMLLFYITEHPSIVGKHYPGIHAFWLAPSAALVFILTQYLRVTKRFKMAIFIPTSLLYVLELIILAICIYAYKTLTLFDAFFIFFASNMIIASVQLILFSPYFKELISSPSYYDKEWLHTSSKFMFTDIALSALVTIDIILLEFLSSNPHDVGYFGAIITIVESVWLIPIAASNMFNTQIHRLIESNEHTKLQNILNASTLFKFVFITLLIVVIVCAGKPLLHLYGNTFTEAYTSLVIMAIGTFIAATCSYGGTLLKYTSQQMTLILINCFGLFCAIIMDFALIPHYGLLGVAISYTTVMLMTSALQLTFVNRRTGLKVLYFI